MQASNSGLNNASLSTAAQPLPSSLPTDQLAEQLNAKISDANAINFVINSFKEKPSERDLAEKILGGEVDSDRWWDKVSDMVRELERWWDKERGMVGDLE